MLQNLSVKSLKILWPIICKPKGRVTLRCRCAVCSVFLHNQNTIHYITMQTRHKYTTIPRHKTGHLTERHCGKRARFNSASPLVYIVLSHTRFEENCQTHILELEILTIYLVTFKQMPHIKILQNKFAIFFYIVSNPAVEFNTHILINLNLCVLVVVLNS